MRTHTTIILFLFLLIGFVSCSKNNDYQVREYIPYSIQDVCDYANGNIIFLKNYIEDYLSDSYVRRCSAVYEHGNSETLVVEFSNGVKASFNNIDDGTPLPRVDVVCENGEYKWDVAALRKEPKVLVSNDSLYPRYRYRNNAWAVSLDGRKWIVVSPDECDVYSHSMCLDDDKTFVVASLGDMIDMALPTGKLLISDEPNRVFYKDVFLDAGVSLTTRKTLSAFTSLGYTVEGVSCSEMKDTAWQNTIIGGSSIDQNGRLLYPDGQPRYRILFVNGGKATGHGQSLREDCRQRMRDFVHNGGSYVGTCAGAFFASSGNISLPNNEYYLHIWPGYCVQTGLKNSMTNFYIDNDSPLLKYNLLGSDKQLLNVQHNGGCYPFELVDGTMILSRYDYPALPSMHKKTSTWAYKRDQQSGMVVMTGSHPEKATEGPRLKYTEAMLLYAADNMGVTPVKAVLRNGQPVVMDKATADNCPERTMIGDLQCHHFALYIPKDAMDITLSVSSSVNASMCLRLNRGALAFPDAKTYQSPVSSASPSLFFSTLREGLYYVSVQNLTTVDVTEVERGQKYSGRTDVLNGVPYTISVTWK